MLNRHILRSKALQLAYAFYSSKKANRSLGEEFLVNSYSPDLNSLEEQNKELLKEKELESLKHFRNDSLEVKDVEMRNKIKEAIRISEELDHKDLGRYKTQLNDHALAIYKSYLSALALLIKLSDMVNVEALDTIKNRPLAPKPDENELKFYTNAFVESLRSSKEFQKECEEYKISWNQDQDFVEELYKKGLKKNESYKAYLELLTSQLDFEKELDICRDIFNEVIFKHALAEEQFENRDISWFQNMTIVKSMVKFTLKKTDSDKGLVFAPLAKNWEEDKSFYDNLFNFTIENDADYEALIAQFAKNWDKERVSMMDKIIIKMALAELEHFPSIPVKVTINEFIDLSKQFSTPKSKNFVNGILDKLTAELKEKGRIKKSGRGLIDNK